jgi:hypothetical protein
MTRWLIYLRHRAAHRLKWNDGYVVSAWSGDALWIAYRCAGCGEVSGAHIADHRYRGAALTKQSRRMPAETEWRR